MRLHQARPAARAGFTLIELSIVILIASLMLASVLSMWRAYNGGKEQALTKENLRKAQVALIAYAQMNGSYPCPASRAAKRGDADFGKALASCRSDKEDAPSGKATGGTAVAAGRNAFTARIGVLPFRSLGLPDVEGLDGWRNLLQYAVTERLTTPESFSQRDGAIDIVAEDRQSRLTPPATAQYVVFSTGGNGAGGYSGDGISRGACSAGMLETENCNDDAVFMDAPRQFAASGKKGGKGGQVISYDDYIAYLPYDPELRGNATLVFYYLGSCMSGFEEVPMPKNAVAMDVETLSKYDSGERESRKENALGKKICAPRQNFRKK